MKVTISMNETTLVLEAIRESEHHWRASASKQFNKKAHESCLQRANSLHAIHADLTAQVERNNRPRVQKVDPFEPHNGSMRCWDPNDPRNW